MTSSMQQTKPFQAVTWTQKKTKNKKKNNTGSIDKKPWSQHKRKETTECDITGSEKCQKCTYFKQKKQNKKNKKKKRQTEAFSASTLFSKIWLCGTK